MNIAWNLRLKKEISPAPVLKIPWVKSRRRLTFWWCVVPSVFVEFRLSFSSHPLQTAKHGQMRFMPLRWSSVHTHFSSIARSNDWLIDWKLNRVQWTQSINQSIDRMHGHVLIFTSHSMSSKKEPLTCLLPQLSTVFHRGIPLLLKLEGLVHGELLARCFPEGFCPTSLARIFLLLEGTVAFWSAELEYLRRKKLTN